MPVFILFVMFSLILGIISDAFGEEKEELTELEEPTIWDDTKESTSYRWGVIRVGPGPLSSLLFFSSSSSSFSSSSSSPTTTTHNATTPTPPTPPPAPQAPGLPPGGAGGRRAARPFFLFLTQTWQGCKPRRVVEAMPFVRVFQKSISSRFVNFWR